MSALLPLPLAGIMSDQPWEQVVKGVDRVNFAARAIGSKISAAGFNIDSKDTPDKGPVVSFTIGDPNQIITTDPSFRGNLTIE